MDLCVCVCVYVYMCVYMGFPHSSVGKESACNAGDLGLIPELGNPLKKGKATHSSILAWRIVHGVTESQTRLSDFHFTLHTCIYLYTYFTLL